MEITKQLDYTPISFERAKDNLTEGQKLLLKLLNDKLAAKESISRKDIATLYYKLKYPKGGYDMNRSCYDKDNNYIGYRIEFIKMDVNGWSIKQASIQWFKNNLGSCIIKGKIIAIPVIEE